MANRSFGGGTDVIGRMLAHSLRGPLGQSVVVENKPGAAGAVGAMQVVQTVGVTSPILPHIRSGAVKPLVTTEKKRIDSLPDVPTTAEVGLAQVDGTASWGVLGPKGLPAPVLDKLQQALRTVAGDAEFVGRVREAGATVVPLPASEFAQHLRRESDMWRTVITAGGLRAD